VAPDLHIGRGEESGMRSLFVRWSVAVVVGSLWGAIVPAARPRAERTYQSQRAGAQRVRLDSMKR
jgi:hypothetical protein